MSTSFKPSEDKKGMKWFDEAGVEIAEFGRAATLDNDITFIKLYNSGGTAVYIYPDAGGTTLSVTTGTP